MKELHITYGGSKIQKWFGVIGGGIFTITYFARALSEYMTIPDGEELGYFFYFYLFATFLFLLVALYSYFVDKAVRIQVDAEHVLVKIPGLKKNDVEWVRVSKVELNTSSLDFHLDGGIAVRHIKYMELRYKDVPSFKQVIKTLCEDKNIPTQGF